MLLKKLRVVVEYETDDFDPSKDIEFSYSVLLQQTERLQQKIHTAFLDHKEFMLLELVDKHLAIAAQLAILADRRLEEIARDKIKYAPHPSFTELSD